MSKLSCSSPRRESLQSNIQVEKTDNLKARQMISEYGIGVDCHSRFYWAAIWVLVKDEIIKFNLEFGVTRKEIVEAKETIIDTVQSMGVTINPDKMRYVCESSGAYHKPLLLGWQGKPSVINPALAASSARKTDKLDAHMMARQSITGTWIESYIYPPEHQKVRDYFRTSIMFQKQARCVSNRLLTIMTTYGITISAVGSIKSSKIRSAVEDLCEGRLYLSDYLVEVPEDIKKLILDYYEELDRINQSSKDFLKKALDMAMEQDYYNQNGKISGRELYETLISIPGVGKKSALILMIETSDITRFPNSKAFVAYCGFDPSLKISAGKVTEHKRRKGNQYVHRILSKAVTPLIARHSEPFGTWAYILSRKHKKGGFRKAQGALARRICIAAYHCWIKGENFTYEKYQLNNYNVKMENVEASCMSQRVKNLLIKHGIRTSVKTKERLDFVYSIPGVGQKAIEEIDTWVSSLQEK